MHKWVPTIAVKDFKVSFSSLQMTILLFEQHDKRVMGWSFLRGKGSRGEGGRRATRQV